MVPALNASNIAAFGEFQSIDRTRGLSNHLISSPIILISRIKFVSLLLGMDFIPLAGPIVLALTLYQLYGLLLGFIIKQLFWLPHRFRHGIYVASVWGNYADVRQSNICYYLFLISKPFQRRLQS